MERSKIEKDYSVNDVRIKDVVFPVKGFVNYVERNIKSKTNDSTNYSSGFYHLAIIHSAECLAIGYGIKKSLEFLIN